MICIYHMPCADGFTSAWLVNKWSKTGRDVPVEFYGSAYSEKFPDVKDKDVVLTDFSYKRPVLEKILEECKSLLILDHHKSSMIDLDFQHPKMKQIFDMDRSGAGIVYDFYFHDDSYFGNKNKLVEVVQDRDLYRFKYPDTKALSAYVFSIPYTFEDWDKLNYDFEHNLDRCLEAGEALLRKLDKDTSELVRLTMRHMVIGGHRVRVANIPPMFTSEAGHIMSEGKPFAACYWDTPIGRQFSLRSQQDGLDVSEIATKYGGGGHAHAAGFRAERNWEGE